MQTNRLLRLINRAQKDLDEVRKEVEVSDTEQTPDNITDEITEVRLRLDALELRVSAIEEGS